MKKNILSVIGAATVAAVALKLTTKYVKNEVIKELEDDGYLYDDDDCDDCDECCGCDERMAKKIFRFSLLFLCRNHCKSYRHVTGCSHGRP